MAERMTADRHGLAMPTGVYGSPLELGDWFARKRDGQITAYCAPSWHALPALWADSIETST